MLLLQHTDAVLVSRDRFLTIFKSLNRKTAASYVHSMSQHDPSQASSTHWFSGQQHSISGYVSTVASSAVEPHSSVALTAPSSLG